jgi:hypothetical protein
MECSIDRYELRDRERPSAAAERFEKQVAKAFYKKQHPEVKPSQVFVGYKKKGGGGKRRGP